MRLLYTCLMWLMQPLLRWKLRRRGQVEPLYLENVPARFGHYQGAPCKASDGLIWVHAVSLGETRTAALLIAGLRERLPGMRLLLTHGTATGLAQGVALLRPGDLQTWQPWDTPGAVRRFLQHFKPRIGILMETEMWPNLVAQCQLAGIPLVLTNARMSEQSAQMTQRLAWLARPAYAALSAVWAQTQHDARRLADLGADVQGVFGNLKFDATPNQAQLEAGRAWRVYANRPVVMFASSREGEEQQLLEILKSNRAFTPVNPAQEAIKIIADNIQWLLVPRHPQRFDAVASLVQAHGFAVSRRSTWQDAPPPSAQAPTVWLGDSLGEMALYYGLADVALLGGSFAPLGGQNLIEATACACPVVMGPHTFNFSEAAELAESSGAAVRVSGLQEALEVAQGLTHGPEKHAQVVSAALAFSIAHRGALEKTVNAVLALLGQQGVDAL
jgi:3-deoxy-D-manno-octulosonic-acid transferase